MHRRGDDPAAVALPAQGLTLSTIDWRVTDAHADPIGRTESLHAERVAAYEIPPSPFGNGVMAKYAALVSSASQGAVTTGARMTANLRDRGPRG